MELNKKLQDALNDQIREEFYSSYLYLSMASYCQSINLPGFAHWMRVQSQEEMGHATKFYGFIEDRGGRVLLQGIEQPPAEFGGPVDIITQTLAHEKHITGRIEMLYGMALEQKDYASTGFLQGFINEQVEEERNATDILNVLKMVGEKGHTLFMVDRQLGGRGK